MSALTTFHTRLKALPATAAGEVATKGQVDSAVSASEAKTTRVRVIGANEDPAALNIAAGTVVYRRLT